MDLVIGSKTNPIATDNLVADLNSLSLSGTLYTGYPILASADERISVDALLVSENYGAVVFHFPEGSPTDSGFWDKVEKEQDALYFAVAQKLSDSKALRKGRQLAIEPIIVSYFPYEVTPPSDIEYYVVDRNTIRGFFDSLSSMSGEYFKPLNAALQRVSAIKPSKKRLSVRRSDSRGAVIKRIEKEIANLDRWQNHAAIESPEGSQCIRGLAGSGKTVVLALKAAYLHARNPDWNIAITFHTRSLYQQFEDLVRRFAFEHLRDEPDWSKLKIIHSWGSRAEPGVYSEIALAYGVRPKNFGEAKSKYGRQMAFGGICKELLDGIKAIEKRPMYDVLLIDEAQDFPKSFFQLVRHKAVAEPHRIVWAYDELQNLGDYVMSPPEELFGSDDQGRPLVALRNQEGKPRQDIVLPVCYRNTPWALATAHAIGFGIYRDGGLVQLFDDPSERVWERIGYEVLSGSVLPGQRVTLARRRDATPEYFYELLDPEDAVKCMVFGGVQEQARWVADSIRRNLREDELEPSDILVILPLPLTVKREAGIIVHELESRGIPAHVAGITSSRDKLFLDSSVAITGIYRAKGNEAPMVYVLNSQHGFAGYELTKRRNTLFTAITRSKGWVRICGYGSAMEEFKTEIDKVSRNDYRLEFIVPSPDERARMKSIYRDITDDERAKMRQAWEFVRLIERGELSVENVPRELREKLKEYFG